MHKSGMSRSKCGYVSAALAPALVFRHDWTIVAGVVGAVLGSGLTLGGVWLTARQRERADRRAAWMRQLEMALGELAQGADAERRLAGIIILQRLATSELANSEDRELADMLLHSVQSRRTYQGVRPPRLDESHTGTDNEDGDSTGGAR